jgi:hypothetical protein
MPRSLFAALALAPWLTAACDRTPAAQRVPTAAEIAPHFQYGGDLTIDMRGNVAQVMAVIDREQYRTGGEVWVKASPYIFLFSPGTRDAFTEFDGLGGVRAIIRDEDGSLVAEALLERSMLNEVGWEEALFVAGRARAEGTRSPGYMRDLVSWGEDHTTFRYNPDYVTSGT